MTLSIRTLTTLIFVPSGVQRGIATSKRSRKFILKEVRQANSMKTDKEFIETLKSMSFVVKGGTPKFRQSREDLLATIHEENPCREIVKDKAKYRAITQGNASDKALNRDCEAIEKYRSQKKTKDWKEKKLAKINAMKQRYKAKYGYMP